MSSALRNFIVTFVATVIILSVIGYFAVVGVGTIIKQNGTNASESETSSQGKNSEESSNVTDNTLNDSFSMLLLGTDYQPTVHSDYDVSDENANRTGLPLKAREIETDAIVIFKADGVNKRYVFITIPSNLTVQIDGASFDISRVYYKKGIDYLMDVIYGLTGIRCDYYAMASFYDVAAVIDSVGGIDYSVPVDMIYNDYNEGLEIRLYKGVQHLNGTDAVKMLRFNGYENGTVSRAETVMDFARSMFAKLSTADGLSVAANTYTDFASHIATNFSLTDLTKHLEVLYKYADFTTETMTYPGTLKYESNGKSYYEGNISEAIEDFKQYR